MRNQPKITDKKMANLTPLRRLTKELAEEIEYEEHGKAWKFITLILNSVNSPAAIIDSDHKLLFINKETIKRHKNIGFEIENEVGKSVRKTRFCKPLAMDCSKCPVQLAMDTREVHTIDYKSDITGINYKMLCIPLVFDGVSGVLAILSDKNGK